MLTIINPATEKVVREIPEDGPDTVNKKLERAREAQPDWAQTPLAERKEALSRFRNLLVERKDELAAMLTSEVGKPIRQSLNEISATPERVDYFLGAAGRALGDESVLRYPDDADDPPTLEEVISYDPLGVVGCISAWSFPFLMGANVIVPALLAGNVVLYKPSRHATLSGLVMAELMAKAGVPADAFVVATGGTDTARDLAGQPLDGLFYVGDRKTGLELAHVAARSIIPVQLELGGKDPVYVCEDVDVAAAAKALADGAFYNAGQSCCAVERLYVHRQIYEAFVEAFTETVQGFVVGDPTGDKTYIGPVASSEQLSVLENQVEDALTHGGELSCGGKRREGVGYFFEPTVVMNANHEMLVMREESFGPIVGIQSVASDDEALALINDSEYGLTAGVFTNDRERATTVLRAAEVGTVYWNCCDRVSPRLPWGGRKSSGLGFTLSLAGIRAFTRPKAWHLKTGG